MLIDDLKEVGRAVIEKRAERRKAKARRKTIAQRIKELEAKVAYLEQRDRARGLSGMTIGGPTQ